RTWAPLAWLASERCLLLLRGPGSSTCLSRGRPCRNKEARSDRASRNTTGLTNDPAGPAAAIGRISQRAQDSDSRLPRRQVTNPRARQNFEVSAYSGGT